MQALHLVGELRMAATVVDHIVGHRQPLGTAWPGPAMMART